MHNGFYLPEQFPLGFARSIDISFNGNHKASCLIDSGKAYERASHRSASFQPPQSFYFSEVLVVHGKFPQDWRYNVFRSHEAARQGPGNIPAEKGIPPADEVFRFEIPGVGVRIGVDENTLAGGGGLKRQPGKMRRINIERISAWNEKGKLVPFFQPGRNISVLVFELIGCKPSFFSLVYPLLYLAPAFKNVTGQRAIRGPLHINDSLWP